MLTRETTEPEGLQVDFLRNGQERRLNREAELALYRIAQQALGNVVRHAGARRAALRLDFSETEIDLEVSDDGIGFQIPRYPTILRNSISGCWVCTRADLIGARLEVHSEPGRGTRISVRLPTANSDRTARANSRI
jgi:signal transduction histidine kinase